MADVLSQSEVESLLVALVPGTSPTPTGQGRADESRVPAGVHEFGPGVRGAKRQMPALQAMHKEFSREFQAALSNLVRTSVEVKLIGIDEITYGEFVAGLEQPTFYNVLKTKPLDGHFLFELNPAIVFPIIDRLLGGGRDQAPNVLRRRLTEIELRLASRITDLAIGGLRKAWGGLCDLALRATQVESDPQLVQVIAAGEAILLASFEISMDDTCGIMNLGIPFEAVKLLDGKLAVSSGATSARHQTDRRQNQNIQPGTGGSSPEMVVYLAGTKLTVGELMGLAVGDIIPTQQSASGPLEIWIDGRPQYEGSPGLVRGNKAVRIGKPVELSDEKKA